MDYQPEHQCKNTQIETISDGKQSQSMKSVSNSSVMVNPSGK
jgi:hypothetical protein